MRDLPIEIYINIFLYLKRKDLQKCYFVCKRWYTMANPLSWEAVTLKRHNISLLKSLLNNSGYKQYFKYSYLIKKLSFTNTMDCGNPDKFSREELLELLNQLSNLNEIDFSETSYLKEYLKYLLGADMQHINKIDTQASFCCIPSDLLFSVYYKFRNSITSIRLLYNKNTINFNSQPINVINSLTQFKNLTKLVLYNKHDINLTPFQIQDNCPNLEHLVFASDLPISESAVRRILDDSSRKINLNFISSLTYLDLYLPSLYATYTRYLVDYFPDHLADLNIVISHQNIFYWIDIVGMELASRLLKKVGSIDKTYIGFLLYEEYELQANNENNLTKYLRLLNSFMRTRQTRCIVNFNGVIDKTGDSFRYDSLDRLFATHDIYQSDLNGSDTDMMTVPDKTSSKIFYALEFNLSDQYSDDDVYRVLKYSLLNFPGLRSLNIVHYKARCSHSSLSLRHKNEGFFSDQAKCDINFLQMEYIKPDKYLFDLVAAHLHDIEIVSLKVRDWGYKFHDPVIDLTGFKKLNSFKYTSTHNRITEENPLILIKYTNGKKRCIREHGKTKGRDSLRFTVLCDISVSLDFRKEKIKYVKP